VETARPSATDKRRLPDADPRFDPVKALEIIERHEVIVFEGMPTMFAATARSTGPRCDVAAPARLGRRRHAGRGHARI
jgi:hypothetical protein